MVYVYLKKGRVLLMVIAIAIFFFQGASVAKEFILERTGILKITKPDGTVLTVDSNEPLPYILSGSIVEVLTGSINIEPDKGFIQVIVGSSVATVKAGDRVAAFFDVVKGMADFEVSEGQISVITGNTTTMVKARQKFLVSLDKRTGVVRVKSIRGIIETVTVGVKASIPEGAAAKIKADAKTRNVHIESVSGDVIVTSSEGKVIMLAKAESINTMGSAIGIIQTFEEEPGREAIFVPAEEPAEPELPEASPFLP